jgi:hydroxymethylpyrimidine kinase/phosphomethylpyrimidine kinase
MTADPRSTVCLTIAGLDPSGGAGIIADIKTFSAFGCFAAAAVTSVTFQNTVGVFGAAHESAETVRQQLEPVFADLRIAAVKTGMLPTEEIIRTVAHIMADSHVKNLIVDPVVRSTSGYDLIDEKALRALCELLFPIAKIITPNIPEAERISNLKIRGPEDIEKAASVMLEMGATNILIKGGHFESSDKSIDYLFLNGKPTIFEVERIDTTATHGTGCTLSSAIAANLALGRDLEQAVGAAKRFVTEAIRTAPNIGRGHSPINQLISVR